MYRPNDVLLNGQRMSNIFNTQDESWHNKYLRPIRNLWTLNKVLEYEPLVDETLNRFLAKIDTQFVEGSKVCPMDEWLGYCRHIIPPTSLSYSNQKRSTINQLTNCVSSRVGCRCKYFFRSALWIHRA